MSEKGLRVIFTVVVMEPDFDGTYHTTGHMKSVLTGTIIGIVDSGAVIVSESGTVHKVPYENIVRLVEEEKAKGPYSY